jgi:hypothetical protein
MYAHANAPQPPSVVVNHIVRAARQHRVATVQATPMEAGAGALLGSIVERAQRLYADVLCLHSSNDNEAEREVELEVEEEEEEELEMARENPAAESDWAFEATLDASAPERLPAGARLLTLAQHVRLHAPAFAPIAWPGCVHVPNNFALTTTGAVAAGGASHASSRYLRSPDGALYFPQSGALVLVSEREFDRLLACYWRRLRERGRAAAGAGGGPALVNVALLRAAMYALYADPPRAPSVALALRAPGPRMAAVGAQQGTSPRSETVAVQRTHLAMVVAVQLFGGETRFLTEPHREALRAMLRESAMAPAAARSIPLARGTLHLLDRSDLQAVVESLEIAQLHAEQLRTSGGRGR